MSRLAGFCLVLTFVNPPKFIVPLSYHAGFRLYYQFVLIFENFSRFYEGLSFSGS
jgi:hypothetical protein